MPEQFRTDDERHPGNLTSDQYNDLLDEMAARAAEQNEPACRAAVPPDVVAEALARLDAR